MSGVHPSLGFGVFSMQGKRKSMEDKHLCLGPRELPAGTRDDLLGLFCVFDGHGGPKAAEYAHDNLSDLILHSKNSNKDPENAHGTAGAESAGNGAESAGIAAGNGAESEGIGAGKGDAGGGGGRRKPVPVLLDGGEVRQYGPPGLAKGSVEGAVARAIEVVDRDFLEIAEEAELADGTTATVVAVTSDARIIVANVGDSEAVLARASSSSSSSTTPTTTTTTTTTSSSSSATSTAAAGGSNSEGGGSGVRALHLSAVHNVAQNEDEGKRVVAAGGNVFHNRLGHPCLNPAYFSIAVSRAIGDLMFKADSYTDGKPSGLTAEPEFREAQLLDSDRFLVIACDGLWSVIDHQRVVDVAERELLKILEGRQVSSSGAALAFTGKELDGVCEVIADLAFNEGSTDNITVMIVLLNMP